MKIIFLSIALIALSCFQLMSQPFKKLEDAQNWNSKQFTILKNTFSFTTGCDTSNIELSVLSTLYDTNTQEYDRPVYKKYKAPSQIQAKTVGVEGCDQKIVYIHTQSGWIANTESNKK